jgi:hypothetical protein
LTVDLPFLGQKRLRAKLIVEFHQRREQVAGGPQGGLFPGKGRIQGGDTRGLVVPKNTGQVVRFFGIGRGLAGCGNRQRENNRSRLYMLPKFPTNKPRPQVPQRPKYPSKIDTEEVGKTAHNAKVVLTFARSMRPTVAFHTLGCKLNFAESSALARDLAQAGYQRIDLADGADVVVINTCSVTQQADAECKTVVRRALKANPNAFVAVTGCYAQLKPSEVAAMEGVDLVLGAKEKMNLPHFLEDLHKRPHAEIHACEIQDVDQFTSAYSIGDRTRAFLKVQDGCDYKCTYCTIPLARGISRSAPMEQVVRDAQSIVAQGIQEVVLTGVNIGD